MKFEQMVKKKFNIVRVWTKKNRYNKEEFYIGVVAMKPNKNKEYYYSGIVVSGRKGIDYNMKTIIKYVDLDFVNNFTQIDLEVPFHAFLSMSDSFGIELIKTGKENFDKFAKLIARTQAMSKGYEFFCQTNPFEVRLNEEEELQFNVR